MRIGFFGGSFDPPHLGHLAVARAAVEAFSLNEVLFAPTARQPLKPVGALASYQNRLAMVSLLCALKPPDVEPSFRPSPIDAPLPDSAPNYTVDTLTRLRQTLTPDDTLFVIIGADAFHGLPHWRSPSTLLQLSEWIVVSRPDLPGLAREQMKAVPLTPEQRARVHSLNGIEEPASATRIRELLRDGSDCKDLLPSSILTYIHTHHLYET